MANLENLVEEIKKLTVMEVADLVKKLEEIGALVKTENYTHNVGKHDRCHSTVEPKISEQWFVKMKELAEPAIKAVKDAGGTVIVAHAFIYKWAKDKDAFIKDLHENYDIDGFECYHSSFSEEEIEYLKNL